MERFAQRAKNRIKLLENPFNLASGHIFVLMYLHRTEICRVNDVVKLLGITSGAATGLTDKLVSLSLIERTRPEDDRRVVQLSLTEQGKETVELIRKQRMEWFTGLIGQMEEDQVDLITDAFKLLLQALEEK
ncbi:MarR family winged helix-turn-helix transcriptional regulator [Paenibacillus sp. CF384]|uniref:MarR family winged helix-turn-helix transcriptional regulator n=1 Tax=Paenibacillus sp. CF384 TaxID=1884382 RepID=UPI00089B65B1|nr:MarR family transcriptional regulator [Paenibacillus sp. CF384]SDW19157.1 DNA-binding transcriptional regulator, MarR family [Paenibacillus sp. CF384]